MKKQDQIKIIGQCQVILKDAITGKIKYDHIYKNMVVTTGKNSIAAGLQGQASTGVITYCALGTGSTAPALADTKLQTEIVRKLVSARSVSANVATFTTFFTTSEGNGSLKEAGLFGDNASGTADSGSLFCHVAINRTKTSGDTLTLAWTVTVG
jgi:hypothetical protein